MPCRGLQPCGAEINSDQQGEKVNCIPQPSNLPAAQADSQAANSFRLSMGLRRIWEDNGSRSQFRENASRRFGEKKENAKINRTKKQFRRACAG
jgi:hypothetical protein